MVKHVLCLVLGFFLVVGVGACKKSKPDPREQPGFKDTTDPSKVISLPDEPSKMENGESSK